MRVYVAEAYLPAAQGAALDAAAGRLAAASASLGGPGRVRYVRALFVPRDELCQYVFEAESAELAAEAAARGGIHVVRVVEAEDATATASAPPGTLPPCAGST